MIANIICVAGAVHETGAASQCSAVIRGDRHADQAILNSRARGWRRSLRLHHAARQRPQRRGIVTRPLSLLFYCHYRFVIITQRKNTSLILIYKISILNINTINTDNINLTRICAYFCTKYMSTK